MSTVSVSLLSHFQLGPAPSCSAVQSLPIRGEMPGKIKQGDVPHALASDGKGCWAMEQLILFVWALDLYLNKDSDCGVRVTLIPDLNNTYIHPYHSGS